MKALFLSRIAAFTCHIASTKLKLRKELPKWKKMSLNTGVGMVTIYDEFIISFHSLKKKKKSILKCCGYYPSYLEETSLSRYVVWKTGATQEEAHSYSVCMPFLFYWWFNKNFYGLILW